MAAAVYTVETTFNPGVPYDVGQGEFESLSDLNAISSLDAVTVPVSQVIITTIEPSSPAVGQVWFNPNVP